MLDSHVLLWYDHANGLSDDTRKQIEDAAKAYVSVVTVWELTLKQTLGKLGPPFNVWQTATRNGFELLAIGASHAELAGSLPLHHRDPFDRMLVAQAMVEGLTLVTHDATLERYEVRLLRV